MKYCVLPEEYGRLRNKISKYLLEVQNFNFAALLRSEDRFDLPI